MPISHGIKVTKKMQKKFDSGIANGASPVTLVRNYRHGMITSSAADIAAHNKAIDEKKLAKKSKVK